MRNQNLFKNIEIGETTLKGVVEKIVYQNEENGYTVAKLIDTSSGKIYTITGNLPSVNVGETISLKGEWIYHKKYGKQISVQEYKSVTPFTPLGIKRFLSSGLIKGVGEVTAELIVNHFGEDTLKIIDKSPDKLLEINGIGKVTLNKIKKGWAEHKAIKDIIIFLQSNDISINFALKIFDKYGTKSIEIVNSNPYKLIYDIKGIGFKSADRIAEKLGEEKDSDNRIKAGIIYTLDSAAEEGHVYLPKDILIETADEMLEVGFENIDKNITYLLNENRIIKENENIYLKPFYEAEISIADKIKRMSNIKLDRIDESIIEAELPVIERSMGIKLADKQKEAIKKAINNRIFILTGGPGTGKTTIIKGIILLFKKMGLKISLAAPTGRAAKKLEETCGMPGKTIHRLLKYSPRISGFEKNESNPLQEDVVIVDESSMMDIFIFQNLLKGLSLDSRLILVGDVDQLPSVGPGNVLKDLILSKRIKVTHLKEIFRQESMNSIVLNAHRINSGDKIYIDNKNDQNFFFIHKEDTEKIVELIKSLCKRRLPKKYKCDPLKDIQVITPMHKGDSGAQNLNNILQEVLNDNSVGIKRGTKYFKIGDKILQTRNNYDKDVYNGDIGIIENINIEESFITINFDGRLINYDLKDLEEITLAYAITVHKSQGSEYEYVILPFTTQHYMMLQRNLLYTAVTRAKKIIIIIGTYKALNIAIKNNKVAQRFTSLRSRLKR